MTKTNFQSLLEESKHKSKTEANSEKTRRIGRNATIDSTSSEKRMSWNTDRSLLITDSFRSVQSSSGVSSTGSILLSNDEEFSSSTRLNEASSFRRTPFTTVKRRHRSSYPSIQRNEINRSPTISGNESDYDNNVSARKNTDETINRRLLDIRNHFLLNTTLDAT